MLELSPACPRPNYSHIVHSPEGLSLVAPQLNDIIGIALELKAELAKLRLKSRSLRIS